MAKEHRKSANFYRDAKDRTYDQTMLALEIMHNDIASIIESQLAPLPKKKKSLGLQREGGKS